MSNKVCSLLSTGKEKRNGDKTIPLTPIQKHKKKVAALLRKPIQKEQSSTELLQLA